MKESWKTINELLNKRSKSSNIDSLKESGSETVHRKDIPDAMNSYFCSVGKDLADKISPVANPLLSGDFEMNKTKAKFHFRTIDTNDLPQAVQNSTVSMYADDTSLCYQSSDIDELNEAINNNLKQLDIWLQGNKLSLNVAKTNSMLVATKQKHNILNSRNDDLDLKIRDNDLEIIKKPKYLGVQIDNSLNWKEHIKTVSTKASRALAF